jgi:flagellar motor switch protein FliN
MTDGSLSQEDIDALLSGGGFGGGESSSASSDPFAGMDLGGSDSNGGPSSDAVLAALGNNTFTPPPPQKTPQPKSNMPGMGSSNSNLNLLMDVTMSLTVEFGRTNMFIKEVLQLSEGAVVELDKNVGEELDLLANGKIIGRGKIIVLDDYYGVQITYIIDPMERLTIS